MPLIAYTQVQETSGRALAALASAQNTAERLTGYSTKFADALAQAATGIGNLPTISVDITPPAAPNFDAPFRPEVFAPTQLDFGDAPVLGPYPVLADPIFPDAPEKNLPAAPTTLPGFSSSVPEMTDRINVPTVGAAPSITLPGYPDFVNVNFKDFTGTEPVYDPTTDAPRFDLMVPSITPYVDMDSGITALVRARRDWLLDRVQNGGTGLPADVEQGIWDRMRDREAAVALNAEIEAVTQDAASGFTLPPGTVQAKLNKVRMDMSSKVISAGREIAIKQAELEIDNINKALQFLSEMESKLIDADMNYKRINLDAAKYQTEAAIQIYEQQIKGYMATLEARKTTVAIYQAMMDGFKARVDAYRAIIDAEKTKSDYNVSLVQMFEAQIKAEMSKVEIFRAQVEAANALAKLEEFKIRKFEAEIHAYTASVNAYTAEVGGKTAEIQGWAERVKAYQAEVGAYGTEVTAYGKKYEVALEQLRAAVSMDKMEVDAYSARAQAMGIKSQAELGYASALNVANSAYAQSVSSYNNVLASAWGTATQAHISAQTLAANTAKMNADIQQTTRQMSLDAAKTTAQVYSQLAGSAMSAAHVNVGASGNAQVSAGFNENWNMAVKASSPPLAS